MALWGMRHWTEATAEQARVLLIDGPADRHNESGLHRGTGLTDFLDAIPYEPTVPIEKVPAGKDPRGAGAKVSGMTPAVMRHNARQRTVR